MVARTLARLLFAPLLGLAGLAVAETGSGDFTEVEQLASLHPRYAITPTQPRSAPVVRPSLPTNESGPVAAILIDDLGYQLDNGMAIVDLPAPITVTVLPLTPHARTLAKAASERGKEVMLHLPMESLGRNRLGPGGLTMALSEAEFVERIRENLAAVPHVAGVNNHMGSRLTGDPERMALLMGTLRAARPDLFFIDSRTSRATVAARTARAEGLPAAARDLFLDNQRDPVSIGRQLDKLIAQAQRTGQAIAIGHPYPETIAALRVALPRFEHAGVRLVPASRLIQIARDRSKHPWHASLSP